METQQSEMPFPPLRGIEHVGISDPDSAYFVPHPWSATHTTGLFTSAFMRAKHEDISVTRSHTGDVAYMDVEEIRLKASLIERERRSL